ncbi:MAG: hypothetical protein ABJC89_10065 [Acidobacteriota bacterium]
MPAIQRRGYALVGAAATLIFLVYALNFLYFFVDDEAIPYVYAQHLLRGDGLTYNGIEGRVEGYSDFLHVLLSSLILAVVRAAHLPKYAVFFIGKGVSLAAAVTIVLLVRDLLRRERVAIEGAVSGLAFLALSGPLAVWSCSSLENVPFALMVTVILWALASAKDSIAAIATALAVLERIDGFVYAFAVVGAFALAAASDRRRQIVRRVAGPGVLLLTAYTACRYLYFGSLLSAPLEAKVLYKLTGRSNIVTKPPDTSYWLRFVQVYGWPAAAAMAAAGMTAIRRVGTARAIVLAAAALTFYVSVVGDWMFGFRFFVPILPLFAAILALGVDRLARWRPRLAPLAAVACVVWCGLGASRFVETFRATTPHGTFLQQPSLDVRRFFWPYFSAYDTARRMIPAGDVIAYNQAGFVPFMLDQPNIDDLGICSKFLAELPTTDLFFTEVGRYAPLTDKGAVSATHAYLLYRDARFLIVRTDLLRAASSGRIPATVMNGFYALAAMDDGEENAIYRRTAQSADRYRTDPTVLAENLVHVSYLTYAAVDSVPVRAGEHAARFPFLWNGASTVVLTGRYEADLDFGDADQAVYSISIEGIRASTVLTLELTLRAEGGQVVSRTTLPLDANAARDVRIALVPGSRARRLELVLAANPGEHASVWINDLRVMGQTPRLQRYVASRLRFPPSKQF